MPGPVTKYKLCLMVIFMFSSVKIDYDQMVEGQMDTNRLLSGV